MLDQSLSFNKQLDKIYELSLVLNRRENNLTVITSFHMGNEIETLAVKSFIHHLLVLTHHSQNSSQFFGFELF